MKSSSNPRRPAYIALLILTIVLGLVLRRVPLGLPHVIVKYGGSMLWATMVYWIVAAIQPAWNSLTTGIVAALFALLVESFKLYHTPMLEAFRRTLAGTLLLGRYFSWWDIAAYLAAIFIVAYWCDPLVRKR